MKEIILLKDDKYKTTELNKELQNYKCNLYYNLSDDFVVFYFVLNEKAIVVGIGKNTGDDNFIDKYVSMYKLPLTFQEYISYCESIFDVHRAHLAFIKDIDEEEYKKLKKRKDDDNLDYILMLHLLDKKE